MDYRPMMPVFCGRSAYSAAALTSQEQPECGYHYRIMLKDGTVHDSVPFVRSVFSDPRAGWFQLRTGLFGYRILESTDLIRWDKLSTKKGPELRDPFLDS